MEQPLLPTETWTEIVHDYEKSDFYHFETKKITTCTFTVLNSFLKSFTFTVLNSFRARNFYQHSHVTNTRNTRSF